MQPDMTLTAQILILAKLIKAEKKEAGVRTTSDCTDEAIALILRSHDALLQRIEQFQRYSR